jgi:hypothetical protein
MILTAPDARNNVVQIPCLLVASPVILVRRIAHRQIEGCSVETLRLDKESGRTATRF